MDSLPVEYYIPEKAEVAEAVKRLCMNQLGGPLVIWAEYIHQWLQEVIRDKEPDATNWKKVVTIVQADF